MLNTMYDIRYRNSRNTASRRVDVLNVFGCGMRSKIKVKVTFSFGRLFIIRKSNDVFEREKQASPVSKHKRFYCSQEVGTFCLSYNISYNILFIMYY